MLRQLYIAGNQIAKLTDFDRLSSPPALVEISVARNPVSDRGNIHEHIISHFRQLQTIDGVAITQRQRQSAVMIAARRRLDLLEEQVSLQDGNIEELDLTQERSERVLQGIERLVTEEPENESAQSVFEAATVPPGPVEPATVAKVEAPLNGRMLWKGLSRVLRPRDCSGSPYQINKKDSTSWLAGWSPGWFRKPLPD